jgi:hypothetical protein
MPHPLVYEIHTRCWLRELADRLGRPLTLAEVPEVEMDQWQRWGFTHIWLMGVWSIGPEVRAFSRRRLARRRQQEGMPDLQADDIHGSPYAIAGYAVDAALGGGAALASFRQRLAARGLRLLLDFIPNHTGFDHPWVWSRPDLYLCAPDRREGTFEVQTDAGRLWMAHGKDPFFPAWVDTAQLDFRNPATRAAMAGQLQSVAALCDGVRCDMAMLVLNKVFGQTWADFPAPHPHPETEFWSEAIRAVKAVRPDFLLLAEAYWDMETRLLDLGFDYAYDKRVTDYLTSRNPAALQRHLLAWPARRLEALAHFLENHDEPRIASRLSPAEHRAAALLVLGLPGLRLLHEGQLAGAVRRANIHLARRAVEPPQTEIVRLYEHLLAALARAGVGQGEVTLLPPEPAWDGNPTAQNFVVIRWPSPAPSFALVVVNLAPHPGQCRVRLGSGIRATARWRLEDLLGSDCFQCESGQVAERGLYLDLPAHGAQLLRATPAA